MSRLSLLMLFLVAGCSRDYKSQNTVYRSENSGVSIYYRIITVDPNEPYIFYLHGGPGGNTMESEHLLPMVTEHRFNWVFMDQRGSGRSAVYHEDPEQTELEASQVTPELMVEDVEFIRLKHQLGKIILYGHSWGGNLVPRYVARYPNSVLGYIIASTAHHFEENTLGLRDTYLAKISDLKSVLGEIKTHGMTRRAQAYKHEIKRLFDAQGQSDLYYQLFLVPLEGQRIDGILRNLDEAEDSLKNTEGQEFSGQLLHQILSTVSQVGAYGLPADPAVELDRLPPFETIRPNSIRELFGNRLIENNEQFYPDLRAKGVFWCGANDVWDESAMLEAAQLAPDSTAFVFPGSGHHYYLSEPSLFKIKLQQAVDSMTGRAFLQDVGYLGQFVGEYEHSTFGTCRVDLEGKRLVGHVEEARVLLIPIARNRFQMQGGPASGAKLEFRFSEGEEVESFVAKGITFGRN